MRTEGKGLRVAAIGDLHVTESAARPYRDLFAEIDERADALVLCGDLTNLGLPREAEILAEDLRTLSIPVIGVMGNHDCESGQGDAVAKILTEAGLKLLQGQVHEVDGVGFAGVKGFAGGFDRAMLAAFGEAPIKAFVAEATSEAMKLENALRALRTDRIVAVLHYAPISATVVGEPEVIWPFLGSSRLAETIDRYPVKLVCHGHAHRGTFEGRTPAGIPVYNVAAPMAKPGGRPYALFEV
ncbi:MAG TPA: metallophosphoesterase [Alphaproteobacteria bacterium]|nr:metallophosphoesterase [Alphaproteobacteria bacterium]